MTCRTNWIASCGCCDIVVLCAWGCATWLSYMKIQIKVIELLHEDPNKINQLICHQKSLEPANICKHQPTPQLEICTSNNCGQEWPSRRPAAIKGFNTWRPWELWDANSCHLGRLALFGWKKHEKTWCRPMACLETPSPATLWHQLAWQQERRNTMQHHIHDKV